LADRGRRTALRFPAALPMTVSTAEVESLSQRQTPARRPTVKQVQIQRPRPKAAPAPLDLRSPSGRTLPF
jgi:hypothetical protein